MPFLPGHFINAHLLRRRNRIKFFVAILKLTLINAIDLLIMKSQKLSRLLISGNGSEPVGLLGKLIHKTTLNPKDLLNPDPAVFDISHLPLGSQQENPLTAYPQIFNNHRVSAVNRRPVNLATSGVNRRCIFYAFQDNVYVLLIHPL